jgi:uncharacterized protein (TIGR03067 family)
MEHDQHESSSGLGIGMIVGVVAVLLVVGIFGVGFFLLRRNEPAKAPPAPLPGEVAMDAAPVDPNSLPVTTERKQPMHGLPPGGVARKSAATPEMIKAELKKFEGTWQGVSSVIDGKPTPKEQITKAYSLQDAEGNFKLVANGQIVNRGKMIDVDPTQTPAVSTGEDEEGKYHGIYRFVGDTVETCDGHRDKPRPTEFASKPGSGYSHEVWKRVSKVRQVDLITEGKRPSAERVARRAMVLALMAYRASLDQLSGDAKYEALHAKLPAWIDRLKLGDELEKEEHDFLRAPLGKANPKTRTDASWRTEGLAVLSWALQRQELPAHDQLAGSKKFVESTGFTEDRLAGLDTAAAEKLIREAKFRPEAELNRMQTRITIIHWRLRQQRLGPGPMDYLGYLKAHPSFKKAWLENLPLANGELVIANKAIADADKETVRQCESIAQERQIAVYWLAGDRAVYSKIDPATILTGLP